jgi:hypothetical protein
MSPAGLPSSPRPLLDRPWLLGLVSLGWSLALLRNHILPLSAIPENGNGDYGVMAWNLWFVNEAITHGRSVYWTREVYYPVGTWLSKHTLGAGFFPLTFCVKALSLGSLLYPVYAYRVAIWLSFALALGLSYALLRRLGFPPPAALPPAAGFAFCRYSQLHSPHIHHLAGAALLPGVGLAVVALLERPRPVRAFALAALLGYAFYLTEFVAFIGIGLGVCLLAAATSRGMRHDLARVLRSLGLRTILLSVLVFTAIVGPFLSAWIQDVANPPKPRQAEVTSANLAGFLIPDPEFTHLYGKRFAALHAQVRRGVSGRETFLGFPLVLLAFLGLFGPRSRTKLLGVALLLVFLVLSLGPELRVFEETTDIPLPYAVLRAVPPFQMARSPVRFVLVAVFALSLLAAGGLGLLLGPARRFFGPLGALATTGVFLAWVSAEAYHPIPREEPYRVPEKALARLVPGAVLNVPISAWDGYACFLQTLHHQPIATGFVSRGAEEPTDHVKTLDALLETDPPGLVRALEKEGITNIIVAPGALRRTAERVRSLPVNSVFMAEEETP